MTIDNGLNLLWALLALAALGTLAVAEFRRAKPSTWTARCRRGVAVFVAAVALFPCVSASDDFVRFEQLEIGLQAHTKVRSNHPSKSNEKPALYLARLLEALENFRASGACRLFVILCCVAFVHVGSKLRYERELPSYTGRSPPAAPALA